MAYYLKATEDDAETNEALARLESASNKVYWGLGILGVISAGLSTYHGFKRHNNSIGAGIGWGVLGLLFPIITPAVAFAQGYGKPKR